MSFWGATVITNLLSAIPWIGQDQVELGTFNFLSLPIIGYINKKANQPLRKNNEKLYALEIPKSFISKFKGLVDGDGYIAINKTTNDYIRISQVINLDISEEKKLRDIQKKLKIGRINVYPKHNVVQLNISRTDLQEILIPLILYHNLFFLTETRRQQFNKKMFILENANHIKKMSDLNKPKIQNKIILKNQELPNNIKDYKLLVSDFFKNWLVGFVISDGSFYIKKNGDAVFSIKQREHVILFELIKEVFNTNIKIDTHGGFSKFAVTSKKDIQNVINIFNDKNLEPLRGNKKIQYIDWLNKIKNKNRYKDLNYYKDNE